MYSKRSIKAKIWWRDVEVTSLQIFWTLQNEESDGDIDIKFAQRASLNPKSEVVVVEKDGNTLVEKEVTPPEKKWKTETYEWEIKIDHERHFNYWYVDWKNSKRYLSSH